MRQFQYLITDDLGIHARPAGLLVRLAMNYQSKLTMTSGSERTADLKKIFTVMSLGVKCGETVTVTSEGQDEAEADAALKNFFEKNL